MLISYKLILSGLVTISILGSGAGICLVFVSLIIAIFLNPNNKPNNKVILTLLFWLTLIFFFNDSELLFSQVYCDELEDNSDIESLKWQNLSRSEKVILITSWSTVVAAVVTWLVKNFY